MKKTVLLSTVFLLFMSHVCFASSLTIQDVTGGKFRAEFLSAVTPLSDGENYAQISSDGGKIVKYSFKTGQQTGVLFDVDNTQGERIGRFDGYIMSPDGKRMLIQTQTERIYRRSFRAVFYIYNIATRKLEKLSDYGPQQTPVWSPDGTQIAFVRDNNIHLVKLLYGNAESQVTQDGKFNEVINGIPDWVYEEEFGYNSAMTFNADGTMICWVRFDESKVKTYSLQMFQGMRPAIKENAVYPGAYSYKYPKAGEVNSTVAAFSYDIKSHQTRRLDVPLDADGYMPRIKTTNDANKILVYTMNRHQDQLNIYAVNPRSTVSQLLIKESVPKYVQESVLSNTIITDNHILLPSDRDGFMQLYLYNANGQLLKRLTNGQFDVTAVYGFDEATQTAYYQAAARNAMNREVYAANTKGKVTCLTQKEGWNSAIFSSGFKYFVHTWSDSNTPQVFAICDHSGRTLKTLIDNKSLRDQLAAAALPQKEMFSFTTSEGVKLNGWMVKPADFDATKKYPVIMFQYSGPGSQQVVNSWSIGSMGQGGLFDQYLTQQGFIVACVDGRGTGARGAEFEKCIYLHMGDLESKDQVEAALHLGSLPYVDKENIGIWGWSFGGFNTLMSMSEGRPVFKAGVAVAPPTDWRFYDTVYTERYMRTPQENPEGYDTNPTVRAKNLHGALLICHGLADDNVHPQNTFEYTEALVQADKDFKMNVYTNRNHSIYGGNTRTHLLRQIVNFFVRELK
ncbi:MAG: S9 family peptidase [Prevotella sp.]|nr:S9 family peptidase [Prevotella sp.]